MGTVWRVRSLDGRTAVAKIHEPDFGCDDPSSRERFLREAEALSSVRHPHVVELLEVGETAAGEPFLVMEGLVGEPLDERLARGRPSLREALGIAIEILAGLEAVHAAGVLHRDVKPENVYLARVDGGVRVKLLDFGLARGLGWRTGKITRAGAAVGTPGYMSPEQARGRRDLDVRTDVYAVGVVLYEMLSGRRPFEGLTPTDVMVRSCTEPPMPLACYRPDLPVALIHIVERAIARERAERWEDARALREALEHAVRALDCPGCYVPQSE
jgi:serine/threonine-protein kinase